MATNVVGFHRGPSGNAQGIVEDYIAKLDAAGIPAVIKSVDNYGPIYELFQFTNAPHVGIFRWSSGGFDLPNYSLSPYDAAVEHWNKIKVKLAQTPEFDKRTWLEVINEPDKNRSEWLAEFCHEISLMMLDEGYKPALLSWAGGEPEIENWRGDSMKAFLRFAADNRDRVAIALHEYDYDNKGMGDAYPDNIGRYEQLLAVCDEMQINHPRILITEWGWAYNDIPDQQLALNDIYSYGDMYADEPAIDAAAIWCLIDDPNWNGIDDKVQKLIEPVGEWASTHYHPPNSDNILPNPSFEEGWYHIDNRPELQIPNKWQTYFKEDEGYVAPEYRVLPKNQLPEHEQDLFVLDGEYTTKVFKGYGAIQFSTLNKDYLVLEPGEYIFTVNAFPDLVMGYDGHGKVYADDPEAGKIRFVISNRDNGNWLGEWENIFPFGEWYTLELNLNCIQRVIIKLGIDVDCPFPLENNGWFFDNWSLKKVDKPIEPPSHDDGCAREPYSREYWVISPDTSDGKALEIFQSALPTRTTVGFSYDDAGVGCGLNSKTAVLWNIPSERHQEFVDWYAEHYPSTKVEFRNNLSGFKFTYWPTQYKHINQPFGANPEYYKQFGLPGHEGVDIKAPHQSPIFSVADGVVSDVHNIIDGHNYGKFVRVLHREGYETTYAHLDSVNVALNSIVKGGDLIGYADNTGNSSGSHLHLTLKHPDAYPGGPKYIGYPYNIIDPTPFLQPLIPDAPITDTMFGVHTSADGSLATGELDVIATANPELVKVMSGIAPENISAIKGKCTPKAWIVRAFLHFGGRTVTPAQFFEWTYSDVLRTINHIGGGVDIWVELHNEPNLKVEGMWDSWANGNAFGAWLAEVSRLYRQALPNVRYLYPGLSPGGSIAGVRVGHEEFLAGSKSVLGYLDGLATHAYWAYDYPMTSALDVIRWYRTQTSKPIFVTEASNNKEGTTDQKGHEYIDFWRNLKTISGVEGVTYFVLSASNPIFWDEIWMDGVESNGIAEIVRVR